MPMKYIKFEKAGLVIFEEFMQHDQIRSRFLNDKAISAGFFTAEAEYAECHGKSVSLGLSSDESDTPHVKRILRGY